MAQNTELFDLSQTEFVQWVLEQRLDPEVTNDQPAYHRELRGTARILSVLIWNLGQRVKRLQKEQAAPAGPIDRLERSKAHLEDLHSWLMAEPWQPPATAQLWVDLRQKVEMALGALYSLLAALEGEKQG